jgi:hypothetical protein
MCEPARVEVRDVQHVRGLAVLLRPGEQIDAGRGDRLEPGGPDEVRAQPSADGHERVVHGRLLDPYLEQDRLVSVLVVVAADGRLGRPEPRHVEHAVELRQLPRGTPELDVLEPDAQRRLVQAPLRVLDQPGIAPIDEARRVDKPLVAGVPGGKSEPREVALHVAVHPAVGEPHLCAAADEPVVHPPEVAAVVAGAVPEFCEPLGVAALCVRPGEERVCLAAEHQQAVDLDAELAGEGLVLVRADRLEAAPLSGLAHRRRRPDLVAHRANFRGEADEIPPGTRRRNGLVSRVVVPPRIE